MPGSVSPVLRPRECLSLCVVVRRCRLRPPRTLILSGTKSVRAGRSAHGLTTRRHATRNGSRRMKNVRPQRRVAGRALLLSRLPSEPYVAGLPAYGSSLRQRCRGRPRRPPWGGTSGGRDAGLSHVSGGRVAARQDSGVAELVEVQIEDRLADCAPARLPPEQVDAIEASRLAHQPPLPALLPVAALARVGEHPAASPIDTGLACAQLQAAAGEIAKAAAAASEENGHDRNR